MSDVRLGRQTHISVKESLVDQACSEALAKTWGTGRSILARLSTVDHKIIGRRYLVTAFCFLALGGILAILMRLQLATSENHLLSPEQYNQIFTMHGSTMMFLFAVPVMEGMATYLVPLMVGTRNIAFPRLNAFSFYIYLAGGLFLWGAFIWNVGPDVGWFAYVPLSGPDFAPGKRADVWAQMITFTEVAAIAVAVEIVATALKQRAVGMGLHRVPIFVWSMVVMSVLVLIAMPAIMISSTCLILDRLVGTHFFDVAGGGDVLLWQHLFWFFGHPEVYIIFLPGTGMVSAMIETFSQRPVFGYQAILLSLIGTAVLAFGLWVHHMYVTGLPPIAMSFFTASSMLIAIPSGLQVFCWIATLWLGKPFLKTPLLFVLAFLFTFVLGGMTGIMVAAAPIDSQVHDTYFVVAHFHYVLIGGAVFPLLGAIYYWFPKFTGRMLSEGLGRWHFWITFIGFQIAFFPMHILGLIGMPRRVYTYPGNVGWDDLNYLSTVGALILFAGFGLFFINIIRSLILQPKGTAGANPWNGATLEWATASPPLPQNFDFVPIVQSRTPLWDDALIGHVSGLASDHRELLITTTIEARPELREGSPDPSLWPLITAIAVTIMFIGSIFSSWAVVWGSALAAVPMIAWFWPSSTSEDEE